MKRSVYVFPSRDAIAERIASVLIKDLDRLEPDQFFSVAMSGGTTPEYILKYLSEHFAERISWEKLLIFWGDERCVPPDDPESNYRMTYEALLQHVPIPDVNVFRIRGENNPRDEAAEYSALVGSMLPSFNGIPQFDMMLLGLGNDGHTASIFPGNENLFTTGHLFEVATRPETGQKRITATGRIINNSSHIIFLVTGKGKAGIVSSILGGKAEADGYPASKVNTAYGLVEWMLDEEAGSLLEG